MPKTPSTTQCARSRCFVIRARQRLLPGLLIIVWIGAAVYFFGLHVLGDTGRHAFGYFWTWDMYPGYATVSSRRIVLAQTDGGQWLRLLPDRRQRFRLYAETGDHRDDGGIPVPAGPSRFDLNPQLRWIELAVEQALDRRASGSDDRVSELYVVDRYWPVRFNLPDELHRRAYGQPNPRRRYWRVAAHARLDAEGHATWSHQAGVP